MHLIFKVKIIPNSSSNKWLIDKSSNLKCKLTKPPINNQANEQLISILSKSLRIPKNRIEILLGKTSKNKKIKINSNITYTDLMLNLKIDHQLSIK